MSDREGAADDQQVSVDAGAKARRRFSRLPKRIEPAELVESEPQPPRPDPAYDGNVEAIRWFGLPL